MSNSEKPVENEFLIGGNERRDIVLVAYDPSWAARFDNGWAKITTALGAEAIRIEHVGSTAVPGLVPSPSSTCWSPSLMLRTRPRPVGIATGWLRLGQQDLPTMDHYGEAKTDLIVQILGRTIS